MTYSNPFVIALKRQEVVERFIREEFEGHVIFLDLLDPKTKGKDVECIWVDMTTHVNTSLIESFPSLKYIATPTTGLTHLNLSKKELNPLKIISLKGEKEFLDGITSTAELAWALALAVWRKILPASLEYREDVGIRERYAGLQLKNLTIGSIGFGRLGKMLSEYASGFGMKTIFYDPYIEIISEKMNDLVRSSDSLEELCRLSDIIFLVASHEYDRSNDYPILDRQHLSVLKERAIVINVSRGSLLDEDALADLIYSGKIFGAGVDVLYREEDASIGPSRLQTLQREGYNVIVTPHIGGMSSDAFEKATRFTAKKIRKILTSQESRFV